MWHAACTSGRRREHREYDTACVYSPDIAYEHPFLYLRGGKSFLPDTVFISTDLKTVEATFVL